MPTAAQPETDGTASWSSTTMVLVELRAAGAVGIGYSYVDAAAAGVVQHLLAPCIDGADAFSIPALHARMVRAVRNQGRAARDDVPVYASGGFTSTAPAALAREIEGYVAAGHRRVKIKIGRPCESALERARVARAAAGADIELMVDGNGAYTAKEARALAAKLEELGVCYFEEPVSSDDLEGLRSLRDGTRLSIAAGEYGYDGMYFRRMLEAGAVDILQADATRCLGITGFMQADALCDAFAAPLSAHCAPALHVHAARAARRIVHVEHFFDHVRLERLLFEGAPVVDDGKLTCDWRRPGLGLELRATEAARFAA